MNKSIRWIFVLILVIVCFANIPAFADQPPDPGGGPGGGDPVGGGSPLGGGLVWMIIMGSAYGLNKLRIFLKKDIQ